MYGNQYGNFPVGYQPALPYYNTYAQQVQAPAQTQQAPQMMTPPTIHAEIIQVDSMEAASNYPVSIGVPVMMQLRDDSAFVIKTAAQNGPPVIEVYKKLPPVQQELPYITRDEFESRLAAIIAAQNAPIAREATTNESV